MFRGQGGMLKCGAPSEGSRSGGNPDTEGIGGEGRTIGARGG